MSPVEFKSFVRDFRTVAEFVCAVNAALDQMILSGTYCEVCPPPRLRAVTVQSWINRGRSTLPPAEYVRPMVMAARAAGVDVDEHELRPDIYPYALCEPKAA